MFLEQNILKRNRSLSIFKSFVVVLFLFSTAYISHAADISFSPTQGIYEKGQTITVDVYVTNNVEAINVVSGSVSFPTDKLSIRSLSKDGSIVKLWATEPSYSNTDGTVTFEGVILNPGFSGSRGKVLSMTFTAKAAGEAPLTFTKGDVLANDGSATSVLKNLGTASYTLIIKNAPVQAQADIPASTSHTVFPIITSDTYPNENGWYNSRNATFSWKLPAEVTAVRTLYDAKPVTVPNRVYDPPIESKSFTTSEDGIMYMHVQFKNADGWGAVANRKFQIDTVAPRDVVTDLPEGDTTTNAVPTITVQAKDDLSGIDHVSFRVDDGDEISYPFTVSNTYKLPTLKPGKHTITVLVYDKASNKAQAIVSVTIKQLDVPIITYYTQQAEGGNAVTVRGTTYPGMTVEVMFTDDNKNTKVQTTRSDSNGNFSLVWPDSQPGMYNMSARVVDQTGTASLWTEGRLMAIENVKLIRIGMFIMNWLSLALIVILASALVIATLWYSFLQFTRFRRKIHRTMKEAEDTLKTNVQALRRDVEEFHTILLKAEKKRDLTKEEQSMLKKFKKRLDIAEKEIERKIEQIS